MILSSNTSVAVCRGTFNGLQDKRGPYVPFWTDTASPGQRWAELAEALPPESEVCGHRAWPPACTHTDRGKKKKKEREKRERGWGQGGDRDVVAVRHLGKERETEREV